MHGSVTASSLMVRSEHNVECTCIGPLEREKNGPVYSGVGAVATVATLAATLFGPKKLFQVHFRKRIIVIDTCTIDNEYMY